MLLFQILWIFLSIASSTSLCSIVSSAKHGQLTLGKSGKFQRECVSDLVFENQETRQKFCLSTKIKATEKLECVACNCGQEKKPVVQEGGDEVGVVGGEEVGEHQYPWYAAILLNGENWYGQTYSKNKYSNFTYVSQEEKLNLRLT